MDSADSAELSRRQFTSRAGVVAAAAALPATVATPAAAAAPAAPPAAAPAPRSTADWETCLGVARALLVLDDDDRPLVPRYERILLGGGLPRGASAPKEVLVLGAGPAGMVAASLLKRAGHRVTVIEANGNRAGGRIKTFRTGGHENAAQAFADPKQYAEAGAMRIPGSHPLVMGLIDKLGIERRPFRYVDTDPAGKPRYRTWIRVNGISTRRADYAKDPRAVNRSFGVPKEYENVPAADIVRRVLDPVRDEYSTRRPDGTRVDKPMPELLEGWARIVQRFGDWSMYRFLTEHAGLDTRTVDLIGTLENMTSRLPLSFLHSFISQSLISPGTAFHELTGGTAVLADALLDQVRDEVRFDRRVTRVETRQEGKRVVVDTVSEGRGGKVVQERFTGDAAIVTIPFSGLRHVQISPRPSYAKRRAITEVHYDSATKVLLEFSRRWWEFAEEDWRRELDAMEPGLYDEYRKGRVPQDGRRLGAHPSVPRGHLTEDQRTHYAANAWVSRAQPEAAGVIGGGSVTDNANRFMFNPSHPVPGSDGGVVLASYSWADDARRWDSYDDAARYALALRGMQEVYGQRLEVFFTGVGRTQSWQRDPYAYGEASVLLPGQHTEILLDMRTPEGPLHFAGCHTSVKPAWIEGALESAVRAALEVHGTG
ncbi:flavin monoamine oxidase family protein [Streptomyces ficellus]|uniref:FAD-dependent oxidoreductase n=1 Tax=Streptomyces ficellus TaxID=1977088 RepID=A0A6I6FQH3_9ACTN|nr:NAD(P)/FAD-dependent oxidoreductase [Streptomyces ficellus]QGV81855.1 FAD-dependent oxidoreductase [Streptomyces ficellus]